MIILYFIISLFVAFFVWLGLRRKWKTLIWTLIILFIVIITGWFLFLNIISKAFGSKCEENRVWTVENYMIIEKKCIGFAGPSYYPVYLYKDGKEIDQLIFIKDSACILEFKSSSGDTLTFDICEKKTDKLKK